MTPGGVTIGEGLETCMAARQLGFRGVWATGSAGAIASFPVLPGVGVLTILVEHDEANRRAREACATRWVAAGRDVVFAAPKLGKDLNEAIIRGLP
jgi:putative DNA primase/helicase